MTYSWTCIEKTLSVRLFHSHVYFIPRQKHFRSISCANSWNVSLAYKTRAKKSLALWIKRLQIFISRELNYCDHAIKPYYDTFDLIKRLERVYTAVVVSTKLQRDFLEWFNNPHHFIFCSCNTSIHFQMQTCSTKPATAKRAENACQVHQNLQRNSQPFRIRNGDGSHGMTHTK